MSDTHGNLVLMPGGRLYDTAEWERVRQAVIERDGGCTVGRLLDDPCSGELAAHHKTLVKDCVDPYALDVLICVCARHHVHIEKLAKWARESREDFLPDCNHRHPYASGREACRRRRAAKLGIVLDQAA